MSKELTDAWKAGKLNDGLYYIRLEDDTTPIAELETWCRYNIDEHNELTQEFFGYPKNVISEVLAPIPSYDQFVELTEKVKELEQDVKTLTNNYKLLEKQQAENLAHGQALVDEFGDFETLYEELQNLRSLLKECQKYFRYMTSSDMPLDTSFDYMDVKLLDRINAEIGESEEK